MSKSKVLAPDILDVDLKMDLLSVAEKLNIEVVFIDEMPVEDTRLASLSEAAGIVVEGFSTTSPFASLSHAAMDAALAFDKLHTGLNFGVEPRDEDPLNMCENRTRNLAMSKGDKFRRKQARGW